MLVQVVSSVLILVLTRVLWRRWKYDLHRIPSPPTIPFLFETLKVLRSTDKGDLSQLIGRYWKLLGCPKIMKFSLAGVIRLCVHDMECAKFVVMATKDPLPRTSANRTAFVALLGNDPTADFTPERVKVDPYVKAVRRIYTTAFQSSNLKLAMPQVSSVIDKAMNILEAERQAGPVDFQDLSVRMSLDVIGEAAYGANFGGLDQSRPLQKLLKEVGHIVEHRFADPLTILCTKLFPNSQRTRQENNTIDRLTQEWTRVAQEIVDRVDPPPGEKPIWYSLKYLINPETAKPVSFETLRAEVAAATIGGVDTMGHQLAWLLALIATHPQAEKQILEELLEHGLTGPKSRDVQFDDLGSLAYLNAVIKEGMRVASVALAAFPRETERDMTLLGYRVPKGSQVVLLNNRWMNSEEEWGKDPEAFRPQRWLTGEDLTRKYYLGFGLGPRDCIGQRLAMPEMKVALISVLKRYRLSLTVPYEALLKNTRTGVVQQVRDGMWFQVMPREDGMWFQVMPREAQ